MVTCNQRNHRRDRGQGMTEYIIIVGLIAIASLTAVSIFGNGIRSLFQASVRALSGESNVNNSVNTGNDSDFRRNQRNFSQHNNSR